MLSIDVTANKCILYTVTWKRNNTEIKNSPTHVVKVEGERHSLLIKWTKPTDAGTYTVTATNEAGEVSSRATLFIKSGEFNYHHYHHHETSLLLCSLIV